MDNLATLSESFASKTIFGLLRSAPDLLPSIKNVKEMYQEPDGDAGELMPVEGKDDVYDEIMTEITGLESELDEELEKLQKRLKPKFVFLLSRWHV